MIYFQGKNSVISDFVINPISVGDRVNAIPRSYYLYFAQQMCDIMNTNKQTNKPSENKLDFLQLLPCWLASISFTPLFI